MALELAISGFCFIRSMNRLTFGFIIHAVIGIMYGPWVAGLAAAGSDLLKSFYLVCRVSFYWLYFDRFCRKFYLWSIFTSS